MAAPYDQIAGLRVVHAPKLRNAGKDFSRRRVRICEPGIVQDLVDQMRTIWLLARHRLPQSNLDKSAAFSRGEQPRSGRLGAGGNCRVSFCDLAFSS
jgi:hypothetical protein